MALPDHYKILGIAVTASVQDVKKAYRSLVHQYHPDKAPDNPFAVNRFREIQDAYTILSDARKRKQYDEERYFAGLTAQKEPEYINSEWLLKQAKKLSMHMTQVDSYRMNHKALHDYLMLLLSDAHLAVLHQEHQAHIIQHIVEEVLKAVGSLRYEYFLSVWQRLSILTAEDHRLMQLLYTARKKKKSAAASEKYLPLFVFIITLLLCLIMYVYSRHTL